MIHTFLVATILMILLVGTISTTLISYNNSSIIVSSFIGYSYANAAGNEQPNNDNGGASQSKDSATVKLREKVNELIQKANAAKIEAAKATNDANNAAEEAEALSVVAEEADKEVDKMLKSIGDEDKSNNAQQNNETESQQNIELDAAISDANDRRKAGELAEKDARDLSDKADALTKAANKAEQLAEAAQKELDAAMDDTNNSNQNVNTEGNEGKEDTINNADTSNDDTSEKEPETVKNDVPSREVSQNNSSRDNDQINSDQKITSPESQGSKDSDNKEMTIEDDVSRSESDSGSSITETNIVQRSDNSSGDSNVQASLDYNEILAQAEKNALDLHERASVTDENISISMDQENELDLASNSSTITDISTEDVNSSSVRSENTSVLNEKKQVSNITDYSQTNNETFTNGSATYPINNTNADNATSISLSNNTAGIQYGGKVDCDVALANNTTTSLDNSGLDNMSTVGQDDDGGCYPRTSASGQFQYVVWSEGDEDNRYILFKRSVNGKTFGSAITLSGKVPSAVFNPEVSSEGNNVYVVWQGDSQSGNQDILMRKSDDNGKTFGDVINVSNDRAGSGNPEINVNSSNIYVVWDGTSPGNNEIFFRKSINNGSNFDRVRNLSNDGGVSYEPKVVLDKKGIEIYWRDYRNGHEDVLVKKSMNEGRTFDILQKVNKDISGLWKERGIDQVLRR
jgi:hypothetical protein